VTSPSRLGNDLGHLVHLSLRAAERTEPLLRQLAGALVLAVPQQFDDAALIGGETRDFADDLADELGAAFIRLSTSYGGGVGREGWNYRFVRRPFVREILGFGW
jgi:hypothetical protein